jgi:hypothetical protein
MSDAIDIVRCVHCYAHIIIVALRKMCLYYKTIFGNVRDVFSFNHNSHMHSKHQPLQHQEKA